MTIRRATSLDIPTIRQRFSEVDNPPYYPGDSDLPIDKPTISAFVDDTTGAYGQASWFPLDGVSYITWLLPEVLGAQRHAPLLLALVGDLYDRFPEARNKRLEATFRHGEEVGTGEEDFGWGKAIRWSALVPGTTVNLLVDRGVILGTLQAVRAQLRAVLP